MVILVVVAYGAYWLLSKHSDPDMLAGPAKTFGEIAALQTTGDGYELVIIKPDGSIVPSPDYVKGAADQNPTWRPDGGRLFFESDRYQQQPHLYRWNPDSGLVERRTTDKRPKGFLSFAAPGVEKGKDDAKALMISGGTVVEIDANTGEQKQLLPPNNSSNMGGGGEVGAQSSMERFAALGTSFAKAMWTKNKHYIVAVMDREPGDQSLVIQDMTNPKAPPQGIVMAKHIGLDVCPISGRIVYSAQGWEVPDWFSDDQKRPFIKNGKLVPPIYSVVQIMDSENLKPAPGTAPTSGPMVVSDKPTMVFGDPSISPDEKLVAVPFGNMGPQGFEAKALIGMPVRTNAAKDGFPIIAGNVSHLSWAPDSSSIIGIAPTGQPGAFDVVLIEAKPHGVARNLTQGHGVFVDAAASPQKSGG